MEEEDHGIKAVSSPSSLYQDNLPKIKTELIDKLVNNIVPKIKNYFHSTDHL